MNSLTLSTISWLHLTEIQTVFDKHGLIFYEGEKVEELRDVLIGQIENGEILESEIL